MDKILKNILIKIEDAGFEAYLVVIITVLFASSHSTL